jgi:hypothetical protein
VEETELLERASAAATKRIRNAGAELPDAHLAPPSRREPSFALPAPEGGSNVLGSYHFDGDPDALIPGYERQVSSLPVLRGTMGRAPSSSSAMKRYPNSGSSPWMSTIVFTQVGVGEIPR